MSETLLLNCMIGGEAYGISQLCSTASDDEFAIRSSGAHIRDAQAFNAASGEDTAGSYIAFAVKYHDGEASIKALELVVRIGIGAAFADYLLVLINIAEYRREKN